MWARGEFAVVGHGEQDEALAAFGLELEGKTPERRQPEFWLWPENVPVWQLWQAVQTQWRIGMAGATGLDYAGVEALVRMRRLSSRAEMPELIEGLQTMEVATLDEWARKAERKAKR